MTDNEKARQRAKEKARLRRQQEVRRQKMILGIVLLVVVVIIVAIVAIPKKGSSKKESTNKTETLSTKQEIGETIVDTSLSRPGENAASSTDSISGDTISGESKVEGTSGDTISSESKIENTPNENLKNPDVTPTDTSSFAVQPGVPCGGPMTDEKIVYLTLDDGPSYLTEQFLDVLDRYNVKATFFVTGQNPEYYPMIAEAARRGHTIGLHTYTHDYSFVYSSIDNYFTDLAQIGAIVEQQIGYVPCFIRFPGGSANYISHDYTPGIMTMLSELVQQQGYQYYDWNCSSGDGATVEDPNLLVAAATNNIFDTVMLLSHDGNGKETTLQALPQIIEHYLNEGYEFRPITRESYTSHQTIEN